MSETTTKIRASGILAWASWLVVLIALNNFATDVLAYTREMKAQLDRPLEGGIQYSAQTSALQAEFVFTNVSEVPRYLCMRGIVTAKAGGSTKTIPICTGDLKPHTTISIAAPYDPGAVKDLCAAEPDRLGLAGLDWSKCDFTVVGLDGKPVTPTAL